MRSDQLGSVLKKRLGTYVPVLREGAVGTVGVHNRLQQGLRLDEAAFDPGRFLACDALDELLYEGIGGGRVKGAVRLDLAGDFFRALGVINHDSNPLVPVIARASFITLQERMAFNGAPL
jgi:hypothetical protein